MINDQDKQINLLNTIKSNETGIKLFVEYIGSEINAVAPIGDELFENFYEIVRPNGIEGLYAYITFDDKLTIKTGANHFQTFFNKFDVLKKITGNSYSGRIDFLIIIGNERLLIFDSEDYSRRLDLTVEKLNRLTNKYNEKFESIRFEFIKDHYLEDDFGEFTLYDFSSSLFRFSISDDKLNFRKQRQGNLLIT